MALEYTDKVKNLMHEIGLAQASVSLENPQRLQQAYEYALRDLTVDLLTSITANLHEQSWQAAHSMKERIETQARRYRIMRRRLLFRVRHRVVDLINHI